MQRRFEEEDFDGYEKWADEVPADERERAIMMLASFKDYWLHRNIPAFPGLAPTVTSQPFRHELLHFLLGNHFM